MAHDTSEAHDAAWSFLDYLGTDQHMRFRATWHSKHGRPGLLDIVDDWLVNDGGLDKCPSFETLLIAVAFIVDGWLNNMLTDDAQDQPVTSRRSWDLTFWPAPEVVERWQSGEEIRGDEDGMPVELYNQHVLLEFLANEAGRTYRDFADNEDYNVWDHPIYRRDHFEYVQQHHRLRHAEVTK